MKNHLIKFLLFLTVLSLYACDNQQGNQSEQNSEETIKWEHLSSLNSDLPFAEVGEQVATLIFDVDKDGKNDFVIAGWGKPSMVWFKRTDDGWNKYLIDEGTEFIEAGGDFADIDGDGDMDIVQGGDWRTLKEVWWWENPAPDLDPTTPWKRYHVKNSDEGGMAHHDQIFGDFDGDGQQELVFWNTNVCKLFIAEVPEDPKNAPAWDLHLIHQFEIPEHSKYEGLAKGDIDLDGKMDIVGGGYWYKHVQSDEFEIHPIDAEYFGSRSGVGDLIKGDYPEVVLSSGDHVNSLNLYQYDGENWTTTVLIDTVIHGHTLQVEDIDQDGNLDIFTAEMAAWGDTRRPDAKAWILYGDGQGNFTKTILSEGVCHHESKVGDLDGDGDMDILGKPFIWNGSPIEVWLNTGKTEKSKAEITKSSIPPAFLSRKIDGPPEHWYGPFSEGSAVFDVDNDGVLDIMAGANWYKGPDFVKQADFRDIRVEGEFVSNGCDHPLDINSDGWIDVISNGWFGDQNVYWYQNPGPSGGKWQKNLLLESVGTEFTFFEDLDNDGDPDLIPSHWEQTDLCWYENQQGKFIKHVVGPEGDKHGLGFGDINSDGQKDIVTIDGWYEAPQDYADGDWIWHPEFSIRTRHASMPILVHDVNADGKNDVIYGEAHAYGLYWIEQTDNHQWKKHAIDESWSQVHSLELFDINEDGKLDLVTGKRLRGHSGNDPGSSDPLGIYWYEIDSETQQFNKNVITYNARIGTGMQINIQDINNDADNDLVVSGKSGLYVLENMKNFKQEDYLSLK
ncbi:MAG: FG-GAP repeat domain-containing protein [Candidatus Cyclobacteriaceae bacterium M3_2C_046]